MLSTHNLVDFLTFLSLIIVLHSSKAACLETINMAASTIPDSVKKGTSGCVQILTGEEPYPRVSLKELMNGISSGSMRPELPPTCPPLLKSLLHESWGLNHTRPTFSSICKVLEHLQSSPPAGTVAGPSCYSFLILYTFFCSHWSNSR